MNCARQPGPSCHPRQLFLFSFVCFWVISFGGMAVAQEEREAVDRNGDGVPEAWLVEEGDKPVRSEVDRNGDGKPDLIRFLKEGQPQREQADLNFDGKPDAWSYFTASGAKSLMIQDKNDDGKPDAWFYYDPTGLKLIGSRLDEDFDGTPDRTAGAVPQEETRRSW